MLHTEFRHSVRNRVTYRNKASSKKSRYMITVHTELKHPVRNHVTYWICYGYPEGPGVCITSIIADSERQIIVSVRKCSCISNLSYNKYLKQSIIPPLEWFQVNFLRSLLIFLTFRTAWNIYVVKRSHYKVVVSNLTF